MKRLSTRLSVIFLSIALALVVIVAMLLIVTSQSSAMERKYQDVRSIYVEARRIFVDHRRWRIYQLAPESAESYEDEVGNDADDFGILKMDDTSRDNCIDTLGREAGALIYIWQFHQDVFENLPDEIMSTEIAQDIKRAKYGEATFRAPSNWYTGRDGVVTYVVPLEAGSGIEGAIIIYTISGDMFAETLAAWRWIFIGGAVASIVLVVLIRAAANRIALPLRQMNTAAMRLAEGETVTEIPVTTEDEVGDLARAFNHMRRRLGANERMRRDFFAGVSHDLRTPLTSISGFVKGLKEGWISPEQVPETLDILAHETQRLQDMTDTLLDIARLEGGVLEIKREQIQLQTMLEEAIHAANIDASLTVPMHCVVIADRRLLRRAVSNLIENAKRYGAPPLEVFVRETMDYVSIYVRDHGNGVPEDALERIFERYITGGKGSGLGLFLVRETMRLHGGSAAATNLPGEGFEVVLRLPM